jgi:hypothetical protein
MRQTGLADRDEIAFGIQRFDESRAGVRAERRDPKITPVANLPGRHGVHNFRGKFRQKLRGGHQGFRKAVFFRKDCLLFQRVGRLDFKIA